MYHVEGRSPGCESRAANTGSLCCAGMILGSQPILFCRSHHSTSLPQTNIPNSPSLTGSHHQLPRTRLSEHRRTPAWTHCCPATRLHEPDVCSASTPLLRVVRRVSLWPLQDIFHPPLPFLHFISNQTRPDSAAVFALLRALP